MRRKWASRARFPKCARHGRSGAVAVDQGPFSFSPMSPTCGAAAASSRTSASTARVADIEIRPRTVKVRVPAGVDDDQHNHVKGRGTPGLNGGPAGDLYVVVHVAPHTIFGRSGKSDLTVKVPITFHGPRSVPK